MIDLELLEQVIVKIRELYDLVTAEFYGMVPTNRYFPWELQIWDTADAATNFQEHTRHDWEKGRS